MSHGQRALSHLRLSHSIVLRAVPTQVRRMFSARVPRGHVRCSGSGPIAPGEALGRGKHDVDAPRHRERNLPIRTQRVESRPAKGRATSRKRVLRGVWVTSAAKRRQRACRPLRSSSEKTTSRRPTPLRQRKAASCSRSGLAARLLRGLRTVACTHWGSSGNLGGPVVSVETNRFSGSGRKVQADARRCP